MTFEARPGCPTQNTNRAIEAFQIEAQTQKKKKKKKNLDPGKLMPNSNRTMQN